MNDSNNTLRKTQPGATAAPRLETPGPLLIAGLREPLDEQAAQKIPQLWQRLVASGNEIPQRVGTTGYGLCIHQDSEYYYMAGYAVWDFTDLPEAFSPFIIPSHTYAVFPHAGNVNCIRDTIDFIFDQWLPGSGYQPLPQQLNSVHFFERYGEQFNLQTGEGDIEIWLPLSS